MPSCTCVCGARFRFAEESIGKKAKCKKCGVVFTLEVSDAGLIPLADDGTIPLAKDEPTGTSTIPPGGTALDEPRGAPVVEGSLPTPPPGFVPPTVIIEKPERERTYTGDLLGSLVYMFRWDSLLTFLFVWFVVALAGIVLPFCGCAGLVGLLVVTGWYCAFRFAVVRQGAGDEPGLPEVAWSDGWFEGGVVPFFSWIASWLIVLIPAVVGLGLEIGFGRIDPVGVARMLTGDVSTMVVDAVDNDSYMFLGGLVLGLFMWPIIILCFALGGVASLGRLDLIVETVFKTFPVYLLTVLIIYVTIAIKPSGDLLGPGFVNQALVIGLGMYLELVALRAVGLYYHHHKDKFAWSWG